MGIIASVIRTRAELDEITFCIVLAAIHGLAPILQPLRHLIAPFFDIARTGNLCFLQLRSAVSHIFDVALLYLLQPFLALYGRIAAAGEAIPADCFS